MVLFARIYDEFPNVTVSAPWPRKPGCKLSARIRFEGIQNEGVIERTLDKTTRQDGSVDWTAFHDKLWIPPSQQGHGFARALDRYVARRYREIGIDRISLLTEGRGNYVWATLDYDPAGSDRPADIAVRAIGRLRQWRTYGVLRELDTADWERIDRELMALKRPYGAEISPRCASSHSSAARTCLRPVPTCQLPTMLRTRKP
jgi:GNAT superfamily N-acetyltransferase